MLRVDTTVTGFPALGTEPALLVARGGDSLDIRGVIRFDSIPYLFKPPSSDTLRRATIAFQPYLRLRLDSTRFKSATAGSLTVEVYDVDTAGNDTAVAVLASLFRPDRFLGEGSFDSLDDSVRIPLDSGKIAAAEDEGWFADIDRADAGGSFLFVLPQFVVRGIWHQVS